MVLGILGSSTSITSTACWSGKQTIFNTNYSHWNFNFLRWPFGTTSFKWDDHYSDWNILLCNHQVMGTLPRDWDRRHLLLRQGAESCIFLSFHGNDEAPFWETWLASLFEESKIAMGHGETLNHAACSSSIPIPNSSMALSAMLAALCSARCLFWQTWI